MNAVIVSNDLKEFMEANMHMTGQVHSVFNSAVNLITESDDLITLLCERKSIAPMSMMVKCDKFSKLLLKKGSQVVLMGSKIHFPDSREQITLRNAEEWSVEVDLKFKPVTPQLFKKHISTLENVLDREGNMDGIASIVYHLSYPDGKSGFRSSRTVKMNQYASFIHDRIQQFMDDFQGNDMIRYQEDLRKIIGFGPGLTPSTDDFMVGFSASLLYMTRLFGIKKRLVNHVNKRVYECSKGRTTRVSEELIKHVSEGKMSKLLQDMFTSLFSKEDDVLHGKLVELVSYGDTSGPITSRCICSSSIIESEEVRRIYS